MLQFEDPASYDGRYHRAGSPGGWYASLTERGAWAELFRHWDQHEISRSRCGVAPDARITDLVVLDLTDPAVRNQLEVTKADLTGDNLATCQDLAEQARAAGGPKAAAGALGP
ncbi:MAG: RES domain-containing protein [Nitriliruptorales bacterium]|nr:RES domain-containing protein [Nitriliruptorales bacterium]